MDDDAELSKIRAEKAKRLLSPQKAPQPVKVTVYSTSTCPYCIMAKQYLRSVGVPFEEINLTLDPSRVDEMVEKSGQMGVPVIDVAGTVVVGFNRPALDSALAKAGAAVRPAR